MTMPGGSFDWASLYQTAQSTSFEPIPKGPYHVSIIETEEKRTSNGKPMIKLKLNVEDGQYANRKLWDQFVLSVDNEQALGFFFRNCKAFGLDENFFRSVPPGQLAPVAHALFGKHAIANVELSEWQGNMRNQVKDYAPYTGGMVAGPGPMAGGVPMGPMPGMMPGPVPAAMPVQTAPVPQGAPIPAPASAPTPAPTPAAQPVAAPSAPVAPPAAPTAEQLAGFTADRPF